MGLVLGPEPDSKLEWVLGRVPEWVGVSSSLANHCMAVTTSAGAGLA